ncbi:transglycosylase SLT domain-containing protein [Shimia sp. SDUM112013]|uniref:transglycosylase SLT domain-containing protein n=1 Tax=Shimia sp. SDUM112013 TaxID=3136160 RepID=UPI0032EBB1EA
MILFSITVGGKAPRCSIPVFLAMCFALLSRQAFAAVETPSHPSTLCEKAALFASSKTGVPLSILRAITRTETGKKHGGLFGPWPWAVNLNGKGFWFDDVSTAHKFVMKQRQSGVENFDLGCFQINYRWHGDAFESLEEMLSPEKNALYAAKFLERLYKEKGDWPSAIGAYHSRTPKHASRYLRAFNKSFEAIHKAPPLESSNNHIPRTNLRENLFPLLTKPSLPTPSLGSLVPLQQEAPNPMIHFNKN